MLRMGQYVGWRVDVSMRVPADFFISRVVCGGVELRRISWHLRNRVDKFLCNK